MPPEARPDPLVPLLRKLSWPAVGRLAAEVRVVMVPVGSIEQHGPHLPLDVDVATVEHLAFEAAKQAATRLQRPAAVLAPSIPFGGPGLGMDDWPGTVRLRPQVFIDLYRDVAASLARTGFRFIVALNGCAGNIPALALACQLLKSELPEHEFLVVDSIWAGVDAIAAVRDSEPGGTGHACEIETSIALAIDPGHVNMEQAVDEIPAHPSANVSMDFGAASAFTWPVAFRRLTRSGVMGRPSLASAEKGRTVLQAATARVSAVLLELHSLRPTPGEETP